MKKSTLISMAIVFTASTLVHAESDHHSTDASHKHDISQQEITNSPQRMQARIIEIQKEPDLKKRQAAMNEHMQEMQKIMGATYKDGKNASTQMQKQHQAMQAEIMTITNEPNAEKRMAMLTEHLKKMQQMKSTTVKTESHK